MKWIALVVLAGCAVVDNADPGATVDQPLVGVDGSQDQADRNCNVVLRSLDRTGTATTSDSYVWEGAVETSAAAAAENLVPAILYNYDNQGWHTGTVGLAPSTQPTTPGYKRYAVRLDHDLLGPGMSAAAFASAHIEVVPYLPLAGGGRLFDHNRNPDDFTNYTMTAPALAVPLASGTCAPPTDAQHANLTFAADFTQHRDGVLSAGGTVTVLYDTSRLAQCQDIEGGHPRYDITANVRFDDAPAQTAGASVRDGAATFAIPTDGAQHVAVWFETTSVTGCHAFDSNFGNNYVFDLARAPQWIGNAQTLLQRDAADPCDGGTPAAAGFRFDTWARQRAAITNLCFEVYQPGLTDRDDPDLWQKLDAAVRWHVVGDPTWHTTSAPLARTGARRGNNARYAVSWRPIDPFQPYQCPTVAPTSTPDGMYRQLQVEYYVVVNGGELRPEPGAAFSGTFLDYPSTTCP